MSISNFLSLAKETNYNFVEMFNQAPKESLILLSIVLVIVLVLAFFIIRAIKISNAIKLIDKLEYSKSYEECNEKLSFLAQELPKRGEKVASALNSSKAHILLRISKLVVDTSIKEKIQIYLQVSKNFEKLAEGSKKYNIGELTSFYQTKSKELLDENLIKEIKYYYENVHINLDEIDNINAIVKYANSLKDNSIIINPLLEQLNRFSYAYNLSFYKFIEKLDENSSKQVYKNCKEKINKLFTSGEDEVSVNILDYLLEKEEKQKVYDYISNLKIKSYLQQLYYIYFDKKDDINLDLAFVANPVKIEEQYKAYIDNSLTSNWKDEKHIEFISKAPGVIEVLGHLEFRTLIQRIDSVEKEKENRKMVEEALSIAKRAETIALEAKALNKQPLKSR